MKRFLVGLMVIFCFCVSMALAFNAGDEEYFGLYWDGKLFGYSHYFISQRLSLADKNFYKISSDSLLKVGIGKIEELEYISELTVDEKTLLPSFLNTLQVSRGQKINLQVIISKNLIAQKNIFGQEELDYFKEIDKPMYFLVKNLWGGLDTFVEHFLILANIARTSPKEEEIFVYDPISRSIQKIYLSYKRDLDIDSFGKILKTEEFVVSDESGNACFKIYLQKGNKALIKVSHATSPVTIEMRGKEIVKKVKEANGLDLFASRSARSDFVIPDPDKVDFLKIKFNGKIFGQTDLNHKVLGYTQDFNGKTEENLISGTFEVRSSNVEFKSFDFPLAKALTENYQSYLKPELQIESDDPEIKTKARSITVKSKNVEQAVNKILDWIKLEIKVGQAIPSAKLTLKDKVGNSESLSYLFVALCRASGIPARSLGGLLLSGGNFVPHYWAEVYVEPDGWLPVDPTLKEVEKLSALHIALWRRGDLSGVELEVEDFSPRPVVRIPYFKKEMAWNVGEERIYKFYRDGEEIGKETVVLKELSLYKDKESYMFTSVLEVPNQDITSIWHLDDFGLPISYRVDYNSKQPIEKKEYEFENGFVKCALIQGDKKSFSKALYNYGAYLCSEKFLSQIALAVGQVPPFKVGGNFEIYFFIPEKFFIKPLKFKVDIPEKVKSSSGRIYDSFRCSAEDGMTLWVTGKGMLIRLEAPEENLEYVLDSARNIYIK